MKILHESLLRNDSHKSLARKIGKELTMYMNHFYIYIMLEEIVRCYKADLVHRTFSTEIAFLIYLKMINFIIIVPPNLLHLIQNFV